MSREEKIAKAKAAVAMAVEPIGAEWASEVCAQLGSALRPAAAPLFWRGLWQRLPGRKADAAAVQTAHVSNVDLQPLADGLFIGEEEEAMAAQEGEDDDEEEETMTRWDDAEFKEASGGSGSFEDEDDNSRELHTEIANGDMSKSAGMAAGRPGSPKEAGKETAAAYETIEHTPRSSLLLLREAGAGLAVAQADRQRHQGCRLGGAAWTEACGRTAEARLGVASAPFPSTSALQRYVGGVLRLFADHGEADLLGALQAVFPRGWECLLQVGELEQASLFESGSSAFKDSPAATSTETATTLSVRIPVALARLQQAYPAIHALWRFLRTFELRVWDAQRQRTLLVVTMQCQHGDASLGLRAATSAAGRLLWLDPSSLAPLSPPAPFDTQAGAGALPLRVDLASNVALLWRSVAFALPTVQCTLWVETESQSQAQCEALAVTNVDSSVRREAEAGAWREAEAGAGGRAASRGRTTAAKREANSGKDVAEAGVPAAAAKLAAQEAAANAQRARHDGVRPKDGENSASGRGEGLISYAELRITGFVWGSRLASYMASLVQLHGLLSVLRASSALVFWARDDGCDGGVALATGVPSRGLHGLLLRQAWSFSVRKRVWADVARFGADFCSAAAADLAALVADASCT
jgi:hypothetical protein